MSTLLQVEDLHVQLGDPLRPVLAVRGLSFSIERGQTLSIVGESGSGKSMTALALMGLLPEGAQRRARQLDFDGIDLLALNETTMTALRGNRLAMVFQEPMTALNPAFTVGNQLEETWLCHRGGPRAAARARALHLLARVGIGGGERRLQQYPHQLSGGLRQRVMIAMALMCEPLLIIADEPTTALDVTIQAQILRLLRALQTELRLGVLLITHDLGVVARAADRVAVLYAGQCVETGTVRQVFHAPHHPYTRGLLASVPVPGGSLPGGRLRAIPGTVPSLVGSIIGCAFRNRCPRASAACAEPAIPLVTLAEGRSYRCVLSPAEAAAG
jgi:peptide/nickel transport system ATP-binding protein